MARRAYNPRSAHIPRTTVRSPLSRAQVVRQPQPRLDPRKVHSVPPVPRISSAQIKRILDAVDTAIDLAEVASVRTPQGALGFALRNIPPEVFASWFPPAPVGKLSSLGPGWSGENCYGGGGFEAVRASGSAQFVCGSPSLQTFTEAEWANMRAAASRPSKAASYDLFRFWDTWPGPITAQVVGRAWAPRPGAAVARPNNENLLPNPFVMPDGEPMGFPLAKPSARPIRRPWQSPRPDEIAIIIKPPGRVTVTKNPRAVAPGQAGFKRRIVAKKPNEVKRRGSGALIHAIWVAWEVSEDATDIVDILWENSGGLLSEKDFVTRVKTLFGTDMLSRLNIDKTVVDLFAWAIEETLMGQLSDYEAKALKKVFGQGLTGFKTSLQGEGSIQADVAEWIWSNVQLSEDFD